MLKRIVLVLEYKQKINSGYVFSLRMDLGVLSLMQQMVKINTEGLLTKLEFQCSFKIINKFFHNKS